MDREYIDVSIGLHFVLELLKSYRENGLLQASVSRLPGISGKCEVSITIVQGKVTSCLAKDKQGILHSTDLQLLLKLDRDRGSFEWNLLPYESPTNLEASGLHPSPTNLGASGLYPSPALSGEPVPFSPASPKPHKIALLNFKLLPGWPPEQKRAIFMLYDLIDGKRSVEDIKHAAFLSPQLVEEGLRILISLNVITIPPLS